MKKNLIALLAVAVLSVSAASAATTATNPIARWLNNTADSIERVNTDVNQSAAKAESDKQSFIARWKAQRAEAKAQREAQKKAIDNEIKGTKNAFKRLFTWDWD